MCSIVSKSNFLLVFGEVERYDELIFTGIIIPCFCSVGFKEKSVNSSGSAIVPASSGLKVGVLLLIDGLETYGFNVGLVVGAINPIGLIFRLRLIKEIE